MKIVQQSKDAVITHRALIERDIADLKSRLENSDPNLLKPLNINLETLTCEQRFPSLYEEKFCVAHYDEDKARYEEMLTALDKLREELILQAKIRLGLVTSEGAL